jgi:presenilin-like A22 family membrane protease
MAVTSGVHGIKLRDSLSVGYARIPARTDRRPSLRERFVSVTRRPGHATFDAGGSGMSDGPTAERNDGQTVERHERTVEADDAGGSWTDWLPYAGIVALYTATVLGGLALTDEMSALGLVLFEDPGNVGNVGVFAVLVLAATGLMVLAFRYEVGDLLVRALLLGSAGALTAAAFVAVTGIGTVASEGAAMGLPADPVSGAVAAGTAVVLWVYPEWYVNDLAAVVFGAAAIPMLGLGFAPFPVVVLLILWAGYDAYSVYVSGHMQELAAGLGDLRAPIVFIVPHSLSYSLREEGLDLADSEDEGETDDESADEAGEPTAEKPAESTGADADADDGMHNVALLGLGDALIPGMLAVSAGEFLDAPVVVPALNANLPALGALVGGLVGMGGLLYLVHRVEGAHAGLPPLNAGVLGGYLVGAVAAGVPLSAALGL